MDRITHAMRVQHWTEIFSQYAASGLSKKEWCRQNGIDEKRFYYWQRNLRKKSLGVVETPSVLPMSFVELPATHTTMTPIHVGGTKASTITIRCNQYELEVPDNVSVSFLKMVLEVVSHA